VSEDARQHIATPDQRVRVFVSSTLGELAAERGQAQAAIVGLRLTPVMFELGARPHPPRELYRAYLEQSDVFVGIYWQRYGWVAPGESVSGLEDEYQLSGDLPKLMYVKASATEREPRLADLLKRVQRDDRASYKPFADPAELKTLLSDDLAVLLSERFTFRRAEAPAGLRPVRLPTAPTAIIGRSDDSAALVARFGDGARLVTITGPGGVGKTRLALDVAAAMSTGMFDGLWFVDLAPVSDPERLLVAIAAAVGTQTSDRRSELEVLTDRLFGSRVLLVLDNVEHLLPGVGHIAALLTSLPGLSILATSRTILRLRGEQEWPIRPLPVPSGDDDAELAEVAQSPAVRLFVARAVDARPGFVLTAENAPAVAEICRLLEGLPLAIELAAAQIRMLPPAALLERLGNRLDLRGGTADVPERQRTLRSTLGVEERVLLARLSVFAGGWTIEAAESVGARDAEPAADVLAMLSSLVAQSLVMTDDATSSAPRFRMLSAVRDYAAERLDERGEREAALDGLLDVIEDFALAAEAGLRASYGPWAARVDDELDNVRTAWRYAIDVDRADSVYLVALRLGYYFWSRGLLSEVSALLDELMELPSASRLGEGVQGTLLWARAAMRIEMGRFEGTREPLDEAMRIGQRLQDSALVLRAQSALSYIADDDDLGAIRRALSAGIAELRRSGDLANTAYTLAALGQVIMRAGDLGAAVAAYEECLRLAERMHNDHLQTLACHQLGFAALHRDDPVVARRFFDASLKANGNLVDQEGLSYCLDGFATIARHHGWPEDATRLHGAAAHRRELLGITRWRVLQPFLEAQVGACRQALGPAGFQQEWVAGTRLRSTDALILAREVIARRDNGTAEGQQ
jgi:predicted ATPase